MSSRCTRFFVVLTLLLLAISAMLGFSISQLSARSIYDDTGLAIKPAIIDYTIQSGSINQFSITLANTSQQALIITSSVQPFFLSDPLINNSKRYEIDDWITLAEDSWLLDAGEEREIAVMISPATDSSPGSYYAQVAFRAVSGTATDSAGSAAVLPEVNALLFITIPGETEDLLVTSIEKYPRMVIGSKADITLRIENQGNTHQLGATTLRLDGLMSSATQSYPAEMVLPGTRHDSRLSLTFKTLFDKYSLQATTSYGTPVRSTGSELLTIWVINPVAFSLAIVLMVGGAGFWRLRYLQSRTRYHAGKHRSIRIRKYSTGGKTEF